MPAAPRGSSVIFFDCLGGGDVALCVPVVLRAQKMTHMFISAKQFFNQGLF